MATRLYLTNSASGYTPAGSSGNWDATAGAVAKALATGKTGTATSIGTAETSTTNSWDVLLGRWVSDQIHTAGTLQGAISAALAGLTSDTASGQKPRMIVYVEAMDGSTRGEALDVSGSAWSTTATGQSLSGTATAVSCQPFDRIVVEVGYTSVNTSKTSYTGTAYYGGTDATDLTAGDTNTAHPAWVEFADAGVAALFAGQLPSVPGFVDIGTYSASTDATSHSVPVPAGDVDDVLLLFVDTGSGSATISADDGFVPFEAETGDTMRARAFLKVADGTEGSTTTVTLGTSYTICGAVARYRNVDVSGTPYRDFASVQTTTAASTAPTRPAITGTQGTDLVVGAWLSQDSNKGAVTPSQTSGGWSVRAAIGHPSGAAKDTCGLLVMDSLGATNNPVVDDGNTNTKWVVYDLNLIPAPAAPANTGDLLSMFGL